MLSQRLLLGGSYFLHPPESYKTISSGTYGDGPGLLFFSFFQQYQYVSAKGRRTCYMADLGVALGLYHLSPRGFDRVLELPSIHLVWCSTGRAGAHES